MTFPMKKLFFITVVFALPGLLPAQSGEDLQPTEDKILVHYKVMDFDHIPEMDATLQITHTKGDEIVGIVDNSGTFSCLVPKGDKTRILLRKFQQAFNFEFDMPDEPGKFEMEQELKITVTRNFMREFVLEGVVFEDGTANYKPESYMKLYEFLQYAKSKPDLRIEIANYTFTEDTEEENIRLSQDRAIKIVEYMTNNGVSWDKMMAKGYGSLEPSIEIPEDRKGKEATIIKVAFE